jgi:mRNA-degrading endonuclease HigB of HigAB toxin-antitoxin module
MQTRPETSKANDKVIEAKRSESFDNDVFFDIEAKRTRLIVGKFILKRSKHVYIKEFKNRSEANTYDSLKIYFEVNSTCLY